MKRLAVIAGKVFGLLCLAWAMLWGVAMLKAADYYVDDDNVSGPWLGSQAYPFVSIQDAVSVVVSGDRIFVAEGYYPASVGIPEGVSVLGGYTSDWSDCDPAAYPSVVDGLGDAFVVNLDTTGTLDGLVIQNGRAGIVAYNGVEFHVRRCRIQNIDGLDGNTEPEPLPTPGETAYGIYLEGAVVSVESSIIRDVHGGFGGRGSSSHLNGADGGGAVGIYIEGTAYTNIYSVSDNEIFNVTGGEGGDAGWDNWDFSGSGGAGGDAVGIYFPLYSVDSSVARNNIYNLAGGRGGDSDWAHLRAGDGGGGGDATGFRLFQFTSGSIRDNILYHLFGGDGGNGGGSGDYPNSGDPGDGGVGGSATGMYLYDCSGAMVVNNLVFSGSGGEGGDGGTTFQTSECSVGGDGGRATGIDCYMGGVSVFNNTVADLAGGVGGYGGMGMSWKDGRIVRHSGKRAPSNRLTPTYTPSPTPTSGYACCGSGGSGGGAQGIRFYDDAGSDVFRSNIVGRISGGEPGTCFDPPAGTGYGFYSDTDNVTIDYNDVYACDTLLYYNAIPGAHALAEDPLWVAGMLGMYYLSSLASGQAEDSPCIDAGDVPAAARGLSTGYTTQTNQAADSGQVDMGFHYPVRTQGPTPTPTPTSTCPPCLPIIEASIYSVDDTAGTCTDNDGHIDAGEEILLTIDFFNDGSCGGENCTATFTTSNPHVTVSPGTVSLGTIELYEHVYYSFHLVISGDVACNEFVRFSIDTTADFCGSTYPWENDIDYNMELDWSGSMWICDQTPCGENTPSPSPTPTSFPTSTPTPPCIHDGDVDGSGALTPEDALMAFQIYLEIIPDPTWEEYCAADCDGNGAVTPSDALCIFNHYLNGSCDCADPVGLGETLRAVD